MKTQGGTVDEAAIKNASESTLRNWRRLGANPSGRLTKRANKTCSTKRRVPVEYLTNRANAEFIRRFVEFVDKNGVPLRDALGALAVALLRERRLVDKANVVDVLDAEARAPIPEIAGWSPPLDEADLLGAAYLASLPEGERNRRGAYYTPRKIAETTTADFDFSGGNAFLDPCCGGGAFLTALKNVEPEQIFGGDFDPTAVFVAKINLLLKFPNRAFAPQVVCWDFLSDEAERTARAAGFPEKFDFVATNPPWGAATTPCKSRKEQTAEKQSLTLEDFATKDVFERFFAKAFTLAKPGAAVRFLLPESVLNVAAHRDLRRFLTERVRLERITFRDETFAGVATKCVVVSTRCASPSEALEVEDAQGVRNASTAPFFATKNRVFSFPTPEDEAILRRVRELGRFDLSQSVWALGVVTGNNREILKRVPETGCEAICTGKEIEPFVVKPPQFYLRYDRSRLQQVAKEEYYRAPEKLVYRFVSKRLTFAYDASRRLFLNSANILIPRIPGVGAKTVAALLNSELFQFFYSQTFAGAKVLKSELSELPFPEIDAALNRRLERCVDKILAGESAEIETLNAEIFRFYRLDASQIERVKRKNREK
ncbi:MAG: N-6 DNA methylase [Thermoguttaceae bacterium]|nr:N-6 DNA methylase [Thermoguttaceae bacterium]